MDSMIDFYRRPSVVTTIGRHEALVAALPRDIDALALQIHSWMVPYREWGGLSSPPLGTASDVLDHLEDTGKPALGDPGAYSLLLCAVLRHQGVPCRLRYGFADYLVPDFLLAHVITEFFQEGRWRRYDPEALCRLEVGRGFWTAAEAWKMLQQDQVAPRAFGFAPETRGSWTVRWQLVRDIAALNQRERLAEDLWAEDDEFPYDCDIDPNDTERLDVFARIDVDYDASWALMRCLYLVDTPSN